MKELIGRREDGKLVMRCNTCGRETTTDSRNEAKERLQHKCMSCRSANRAKDHPLYATWSTIKQRIYNPNCKEYPLYGGRGIEMAEEWVNDFWMFVYHMGQKPTPKHSIERIDNDWHYCPENCKWATQTEQCNNTRSVRRALGYSYRKKLNKYVAMISVNNKHIYLGCYDTAEEARSAYLKARHNKENNLPIK